MDLGNPMETVMHYLLVGEMDLLSHRDGFPIVSAIVYVMHDR